MNRNFNCEQFMKHKLIFVNHGKKEKCVQFNTNNFQDSTPNSEQEDLKMLKLMIDI